MAVIIDAYNCVYAGATMGGAMSDLSVRRLCQWIIQSPHRTKTTLVIDGRPKPDEPGANEFPELHLVYSGAGIKADTVIAQMVERSNARRNLTIVTNDRAVAAHARSLHAHAQSCETYLSSLITAKSAGAKLGNAPSKLPAKKTKGIGNPAETDQWLKEFGVENQTPPAPTKPKNAAGPDDLNMKDLMGF